MPERAIRRSPGQHDVAEFRPMEELLGSLMPHGERRNGYRVLLFAPSKILEGSGAAGAARGTATRLCPYRRSAGLAESARA